MLWRLSRRDLRRFASFFSIFCVGYFILTTTTYKKKEDSHSFLCLATWSRKLGTVDTMELFILGREEHSSLRIGMSVDTTDRQTRAAAAGVYDVDKKVLKRDMTRTQKESQTWQNGRLDANFLKWYFLVCFDNRMQRYSTYSLIHKKTRFPKKSDKIR